MGHQQDRQAALQCPDGSLGSWAQLHTSPIYPPTQ